MIRLTRRYRFSASHRLHTAELSDEANRELYGKCNNPYGHGHDYLLEVAARGPVDAESGMAVDLAALDRMVEERVLREFRLSNLNDSPAFADVPPTTENLVAEIDRRLRTAWSGSFAGDWPKLEGIRIRETRRNTFATSEEA